MKNMKKQAFNPYLPSYEYIPDGEPYVFGDRVYVYGSHDKFDGELFCMNDYVCWSAPTDDLGNWRYEGVIFKKTDDPINPDGKRCLYAPDVQLGLDGRYYLYYAFDSLGVMSVAVCDTPAGKYEYHGSVKTPDGHIIGTGPDDIYQFDPGVFIDDDGRIFLYSGFAPKFDKANIVKMAKERYPDKTDSEIEEMLKNLFSGSGSSRRDGCYLFELERDMITVKRGPELVLPNWANSVGTSYEGHEFFEASSMRKINGKYYLIYSSVNGHELCYATSDRPDGGFAFGGTLVSNADIYLHSDDPDTAKGWNYPGNNHGSLVKIEGQWYIFYHRQTNRHSYSRQACAEPISINADGIINQVEMTSCGLNGGLLAGKGEYDARIACNLRSSEGVVFFANNNREPAGIHPYFTQDGPDRESDGNQYIANFRDGALAGFKYFDISGLTKITVKIRGDALGTILISTGPGAEPAAKIDITASSEWTAFSSTINIANGKKALFFTYKGEGGVDFMSFILE